MTCSNLKQKKKATKFVLLCSVRVHTGMPIKKVILPFITKSSFTGIFYVGSVTDWSVFQDSWNWIYLWGVRGRIFSQFNCQDIGFVCLLRGKSNSVRWWWFLEHAFHNLLERFSWIMCCWKTTLHVLVDIIVQTSCFRASSLSREKLSKVLLLITRGYCNIIVKNSKESVSVPLVPPTHQWYSCKGRSRLAGM